MAVDANILIFERMKEELRTGKTLAAAIRTGEERAWPSIRDSNFSTIITTIVLYFFGNLFGATFIIGFAVVLGLGVVVSLFSSLFVTRTLLEQLMATRLAHWWVAKYGIFGMRLDPSQLGGLGRTRGERLRTRPAAS
jgi:preprotein translocase subunit SecD